MDRTQSYWERQNMCSHAKNKALYTLSEIDSLMTFSDRVELICTGCARTFEVDSEDERAILDDDLIYCDACNVEAEEWVRYQREKTNGEQRTPSVND